MRRVFSLLIILILMSTLGDWASFPVRADETDMDDETTLSEDELANYFIFDVGTWWDYITYIEYSESTDDVDEDKLAEDDEDATQRVEAVYCKTYNCFSYAGEELVFTYLIDNGNVYLDEVSGYDIGNVKTLSLESFSQEMGEWQGLLYGYESLSGLETQVSCEIEFDPDFEYEEVGVKLLTNNCAVTVYDVSKDFEQRFNATNYYIENLGFVQSETRYYENDVWQYTLTTVLQDTSVRDSDWAEDEDEEEEEDDKDEDDEDEDVETASEEGDPELLEQNLEDYFLFEEGTWWQSEITVESLVADSTETVLSLDRQVSCEETEETLCFATEDDEGRTEMYLKNGVVYFHVVNGETLTKDYIAIDVDGYEEIIEEEDYATFGFQEEVWGEIDTMQVSCTYSLEPDFEMELPDGAAYKNTAIFEECVLSIDFENGSSLEGLTKAYYIKDFGSGPIESQFNINGVPYLQTTDELLQASALEDPVFSDVGLKDENYIAIDYLFGAGILSGYSDGTFKPDNTINRAELLKILVEGQNITPDENVYKNCFPDVGIDWYAKYVCYAKEKGWVSGYEDSTFRPSDTVNKVEALKMLLNSQNITVDTPDEDPFADVDTQEWFAPYVNTAQEMGILEEDSFYFEPDDDRTRAGISEELYRLLTSDA